MSCIKFEPSDEIFHSDSHEDKAYIVGWLKDKQLTHEVFYLQRIKKMAHCG